MKYIYKITGKVSLILYIFMLYQFWHLCQYGGLRRHIPMLALGIIGLVGTVVLWLISKRHNQEVNSGDNGNKKLFYTEMILLIAATLFFGGRIVYSAVPYHGALSESVMLPFLWTKSKTILRELFFVDWHQFLRDCLLDDSVNHSWNSQFSVLAFCFFGYFYPTDWVWLISAIPYLPDQGFLVFLQVGQKFIYLHSVRSTCSFV